MNTLQEEHSEYWKKVIELETLINRREEELAYFKVGLKECQKFFFEKQALLGKIEEFENLYCTDGKIENEYL